MAHDLSNTLTGDELSTIRDAVPALDLLAIRSLRRAGFNIVREHDDGRSEAMPSGWPQDGQEINSAA